MFLDANYVFGFFNFAFPMQIKNLAQHMSSLKKDGFFMSNVFLGDSLNIQDIEPFDD